MKDFINNVELHEQLKQCSVYVYKGKNAKLPTGFKEIAHSKEDDEKEKGKGKEKGNGFYASVITNGDDIVIAFRGTQINKVNDVANDILMVGSKMPSQAKNALELYDVVKAKYPNRKIYLTGHSLGGSLAQIVAGYNKDVCAATFNPYGTKQIIGAIPCETNIVNYCNPADLLTIFNADNNIGICYEVESNDEKLSPHKIEKMKPLSSRKFILKGDLIRRLENSRLDNRMKRFYVNEIYGNLGEPLSKARDSLIDTFSNTLPNLHTKIKNQSNNQSQKNNGDKVHVRSYIRDDGTNVSSHYRDYPERLVKSKKLTDMTQEELDIALDYLM